MKYPCAGIIIYRFFNNSLQFALVKSKRGRYSFPKGKREKGETNYECAIRETKEETGVLEKDLTFVKNSSNEYYTYDEYSKNKNRSIIYYLAEIKENKNLIPEDSDELSWAGWLNFTDIQALPEEEFKKDRIDIAINIAQHLMAQNIK